MTVLGVHHVSINVADAAAAIDFYVDVLGAHVREDRPSFTFQGAWLDIGTQQIHLIEATVPDQHGQHVALLVDDLDATVAAIRAMGLRVGDAVPSGTGRQSFLRDPSGNLVELHQPATSSD